MRQPRLRPPPPARIPRANIASDPRPPLRRTLAPPGPRARADARRPPYRRSSLDRHAANVTTDVFFTVANELAHPTGAAVHATPVTEPIRIPTVGDIVQSLELANEAERRARDALRLIDWSPVYVIRDRIVEGGQRVYANMLRGLAEMDVDVDDALQLLVATKRLGAARIEEL